MNFFKCLSGKTKANENYNSNNSIKNNKNVPIVTKPPTILTPPNKLQINSDVNTDQ